MPGTKNKKSGSLSFKSIETGLDAVPALAWEDELFKEPVLFWPLYIADPLEAFRAIESHGYAAWKDKSLPEHVRYLFHQAAIYAKDILRQFKLGKARPEEVAGTALMVGLLYQRALLWENERPAAAGKSSRAAAQRKGRKAPSGSVRDFFESRVKGWRTMSYAKLLMLAKAHFPDKTQESLSRQISRLRNPDSKP